MKTWMPRIDLGSGYSSTASILSSCIFENKIGYSPPPPPKLSTSSFLTAIAVGSSSLTIQLISSSTSPSSTPSPDRVEFFNDPVDELLWALGWGVQLTTATNNLIVINSKLFRSWYLGWSSCWGHLEIGGWSGDWLRFRPGRVWGPRFFCPIIVKLSIKNSCHGH